MDDLLARCGSRVRGQSRVVRMLVPYARGDVLAMAHREGEVLGVEAAVDGWVVQVRVDEGSAGRLAEFRVDEESRAGAEADDRS